MQITKALLDWTNLTGLEEIAGLVTLKLAVVLPVSLKQVLFISSLITAITEWSVWVRKQRDPTFTLWTVVEQTLICVAWENQAGLPFPKKEDVTIDSWEECSSKTIVKLRWNTRILTKWVSLSPWFYLLKSGHIDWSQFGTVCFFPSNTLFL